MDNSDGSNVVGPGPPGSMTKVMQNENLTRWKIRARIRHALDKNPAKLRNNLTFGAIFRDRLAFWYHFQFIF